MSVEDATLRREILREIGRRPIDLGALDVQVMRGVVYLKGSLHKTRYYHGEVNLDEELQIITRVLRSNPGISDVCSEVEIVQSIIDN